MQSRPHAYRLLNLGIVIIHMHAQHQIAEIAHRTCGLSFALFFAWGALAAASGSACSSSAPFAIFFGLGFSRLCCCWAVFSTFACWWK
jgi:hypothetical protein